LEAVLAEFDIDRDTASTDILNFLNDLRVNHYLLEEREEKE
jgi:hypothetical protein